MGARCINLKCPGEIEDEWSFCSICGQDNRPPALRVKVDDCDHQIEQGEFCVKCGASTIDVHEPDDPDSHWAEWFGWTCLVVGVILVIVSKVQWQQAEALGKDAPDFDRLMQSAQGLGRMAFYFFPAGVIFVVFLGKRWKVLRRF